MRILAGIIVCTLLFTGCPSKKEVNADIWSHEQLPKEICDLDARIGTYGIYRIVTCQPGSVVPACLDGAKEYEEFKPYCHPAILDIVGMTKADFQKWLNLLPGEGK
jgi:hypothetical protein